MDEQTLLTRYAAGDRRFYLIRLSNRQLPGAILAGVDFTEAIMPGVNLRGADLPGPSCPGPTCPRPTCPAPT